MDPKQLASELGLWQERCVALAMAVANGSARPETNADDITSRLVAKTIIRRAQLWDRLIELTGSTHDGSNQEVKLWRDDATHGCVVSFAGARVAGSTFSDCLDKIKERM